MKNQKGFIPLIIVAVIALLVIVGGGIYIYKSKKTETSTETSEKSNTTISNNTVQQSDQKVQGTDLNNPPIVNSKPVAQTSPTAKATPETKYPKKLILTHIATHKLPTGTHRPEIMVTENGDLVLVVREREGAGVGQVQHKAYRFSANWDPIGTPFPVTFETTEFGDSPDHRAVMIGDELAIVYQTILFPPDVRFQPGQAGESQAKEQSLMLARYSLDGRELFRGPIVAHATDFSQDNFPDHALLWFKDRLLSTTGTISQNASGSGIFKIREVDRNANILATHVFTTNLSPVGNGLGLDGGGNLLFLQGSDPRSGTITLWKLTSDFRLGKLITFNDPQREQTFPTGNLMYNDYLFIGYISRSRGGSPDLLQNPYSPYLKILDKNMEVIDDLKIGDNGNAHVHPTVASVGNHLFFAWSKRLEGVSGLANSQVLVEEYEISFAK